jgi:hypothetical protein
VSRALRLCAAAAFVLLGLASPAGAQASGAAEPSAIEGRQAPLRFTKHALSRMDERGISPLQVRQAMERGEKFRYYHADKWKTGFYDQEEKLFIATDGQVVITVFRDASRAYVDKLKRRKPR